MASATVPITYSDDDPLFFTSDTHFGHSKIIKFCNRPFANVEEMDNQLIDRWNSVVPENGIVYHLGDFCWGTIACWEKIRSQLHGKIHLILGNHDPQNVNVRSARFQAMFEPFDILDYIQVGDTIVKLKHEPYLCYAGTYRGQYSSIQLFGHVHSRPIDYQRQKDTMAPPGVDIRRLGTLFPTQFDVGVDNNDYYPISWKQVQQIIQNRQESNLLLDR